MFVSSGASPIGEMMGENVMHFLLALMAVQVYDQNDSWTGKYFFTRIQDKSVTLALVSSAMYLQFVQEANQKSVSLFFQNLFVSTIFEVLLVFHAFCALRWCWSRTHLCFHRSTEVKWSSGYVWSCRQIRGASCWRRRTCLGCQMTSLRIYDSMSRKLVC